MPQHADESAYRPAHGIGPPSKAHACGRPQPLGAGEITDPRLHVAAYGVTPSCANPYNEHLRSNGVLDVLIGLVIATFIIAGTYVGYHYSQDPGNFESHDTEMPHAPQALSASHHASHGGAHAFHAPVLAERVAGAAL